MEEGYDDLPSPINIALVGRMYTDIALIRAISIIMSTFAYISTCLFFKQLHLLPNSISIYMLLFCTTGTIALTPAFLAKQQTTRWLLLSALCIIVELAITLITITSFRRSIIWAVWTAKFSMLMLTTLHLFEIVFSLGLQLGEYCGSATHISFFPAFQDKTHLYMVMELVEGLNLYQHLKQAGSFFPPFERILLYIGQVASALCYMNSRNLVHRDIKPENIMLCPDGNTKLIDFGLSRAMSSLDEKMNTFCGTQEYIAPELKRMATSTNHATSGYNYKVDWWALGILLYELSFGDTPYIAPMADAKCKKRCLHLLPAEVRVLTSRLLENEPDDRVSGDDVFEDPFFGSYKRRHFEEGRVPVAFKPKLRLSDYALSDTRISELRSSQLCMLESASVDLFERFTFVNEIKRI